MEAIMRPGTLQSCAVRSVSPEFHVPTRLAFGNGKLCESAQVARDLGRRAILVTSARELRPGAAGTVLKTACEVSGVEVAVFVRPSQTPTCAEVDAGAAAARDCGAEFVIGLGGGSAIDSAKAIAAVAPTAISTICFLQQRAQPNERTLPIIAIPTTAGSGSEMNRSAILTDLNTRCKGALRSDYLFPRHAIVDPLLTYSISRQVTAATGFDVFAHAAESFVSPRAQPICDVPALRAAEAVVRWLPEVIKNPHHAQGREQLALAATLMGINLACVGTCLPHRVDKALCALHPEIPHGQAVALFYEMWAQLSWTGNPERFAMLANVIDPQGSQSLSTERAAQFGPLAGQFIRRVGLRTSPVDFGVTEAEIPDLVARVEGDLRINPVAVVIEEIPKFLRRLWHKGATASGAQPLKPELA
jgi:alcohol dehydrogenase class IV